VDAASTAGLESGATLVYGHAGLRVRMVWNTTETMPAKKKPAKLLSCPTCGMIVRPTDEDFPFCSDRCRKIDLGKWASGVYKISSPVLDPEVLEDLGLGGNTRGGGLDEQ